MRKQTYTSNSRLLARSVVVAAALCALTGTAAFATYLGAEDRSAQPSSTFDPQVPGWGYVYKGPAASPTKVQTETTAPATPGQTTTITEKTLWVEHVRRDQFIARKLVRDKWFYQTALANPPIVAAVCAHADCAHILAKSAHIGEVADADHYLCRRLTQWRAASESLAKNPNVGHVIALDPMGIFFAIDRDPKVGRLLAKNTCFSQIVSETPELGKVVADHIKGQPFEK